MKGCVLSSVANRALVLNHQAIIIQKAEWISIVLDQFNKKYHIHNLENEAKNDPVG